MIGLCQKAGYIKHGELMVTDALDRKRVKLLIIATNASLGSKKKLERYVQRDNIRSFEYLNKDLLGGIIGKDERSCLAICNQGFADKIWLLYKEGVN